MDELIHYYSVDVAVTFDIDLDSDQIDTELTSDIYDTFVEELQEAFNNNSDVDLDDYDWSWDKEHDYIQHLYISSKLDKAAVTPIVENILDSIVSFERTDELWDGTYSIETHGLDTPPYEYIERTRDYTYTVEVECEVIRFFETTEDGEVLVEKVTKNELKDRAKKHAKKQRGITTLNPDAGNVEYNIGMFNKMSGAVEGPSNNPVSGPFGGDVSVACCEASDCCEALKLPDVEDPYKDFVFTREEKQLAKELQKASNFCSNFRVKIEDGTYDLYEDGVLLEQFESVEDLVEYCEMYSSLTTGRIPPRSSTRLFVENNAKLIDVLRKLPKGTRFYVAHNDSDEVDKYVGITSPDIEAVKKILKIYTFDQLYQHRVAKNKQQKHNAEIADMPSTRMSYQDALAAGHAFRREIADYAQSNDDADYRAGVYEHLDDIEKDEKVFMEEYDFTNIDTTYTKEVGLNDYFELMNKENDFSETEQEFSSAATSINGSKLPAIFKLVDFHANTLNLDYGGGKFDNATEYLKTLGVTNLIYDKFNRTAQHNQEVIRAVLENGGADTCTLSNVLNVIKEESIRHEILVNIYKLLKSDGILYITVFEGKPGQKEGPTKSGYQLARKTSEYIDEVANVFGEDKVTRRGKLIVARK